MMYNLLSCHSCFTYLLWQICLVADIESCLNYYLVGVKMKEKIYYADDIPISITVGNYKEHPIHFHDDLEIIYLLKGSMNMKNGHYNYRLKEGDIYFFNEREMHSLEAVDNEPNLLMVVHIDRKYYSKYYEGNLENNFFISGIDSEDVDEEHLEMLKMIVSKIMLEKIQKGYGYEHRIIERGHNLLSLMLSDFQCFALEDGKFINSKWKKENKILASRLMRITAYMYENYHRKLTLNEIAENEHLSLFYLSHLIKESTGLSFQGLLNFIRVEESEKMVLDSRKKMGAIAEECGFSALRYFVKHFEEWFGMTPSEYREKYTGKTSNRKSIAIMERASVATIEEALKAHIGNEYDGYKEIADAETMFIDVEGDEKGIEEIAQNETAIAFDINRQLTLSKPCQMFKAIGDSLVLAGDNYLIAKKNSKSSEKKAYSILLTYLNAEEIKTVINAETFEQLEGFISTKYNPKEIIINLKGLKGVLNIARYKITGMAVKENLKQNKEGINYGNDREKIVSAIRGFPKAEADDLLVGETAMLRCFLNPFEVELILIEEQ